VKYGKILMEKYRIIASFTTKIITHLIMRSATLPVYPNGNTTSIILMRDTQILPRKEKLSNGLMSHKKNLLILGIIPLKEHVKSLSKTVRKIIFICIVNPILKNSHVRHAVNFIKHSILVLTAGVLKNVGEFTKTSKHWLKRCAVFAIRLLKLINTGGQKHAPKYVGVVSKELLNERIPVYNLSVEDEHEYYANGVLVSNCDWNNLAKIKTLDADTNAVTGHKWVRSGRDHKAMATVFWRVGMMRFAGMGSIVTPKETMRPNSYMVEPNKTVSFNPEEFFGKLEEQEEDDWRR